MNSLKLYLVHCGYYDTKIGDGIFESHTNIFVIAESFEAAKLEAKKTDLFKEYRMHIDGLQEITAIQGHAVHLHEDQSLQGLTKIETNKHRDLAPKPLTT